MNHARSAGAKPAEVLERRSEQLLARVRTMLGSSARRVAESVDYVNEAWVDFLRTPEARDAGDEDELVRRFCAMARNNVRDACRRKREIAFESIADTRFDADGAVLDETTASARVTRAEFVARVRSATSELEPDLRDVVEQHALEGRTFADIARSLGRNEDTVRKAYGRALALLTRRFGAA